MTRTPDVTTVGEALVAFVAEQPGGWAAGASFGAHVVGAELNLATALARLGHETAYIGVVGDDDPGRLVETHLGAEGIYARHVRRVADKGTGLLIRDRRVFGPAEVTYRRKESAGSTLCAADIEAAAETIAASRWVHLTGVTPALSLSCHEAFEAALDTARAAGVPVSLDINYRSKLWSEQEARACLQPLARRCSTIFGDDMELQLVTGREDFRAAIDALLAAGVGQVVRKLGADGAETFGTDDRVDRVAGHRVTVIDPVGAGDAFAGGYLSALLDGGSSIEALQRGVTCGAYAVSAVGDTTALPDRRRVDAAELDRWPTWR